jgi:hypothetical protein
MTVPHHWRECRPVLLDVARPGEEPDLPDPAEVERQNAALVTMWNALPAGDRQAFHRVCCLNSRSPSDLAAINRIQQTMSGML